MRFTKLQTDMSWPKYGGKLISPKQNNSEFDYWFVIELIDWEDATGDTSQGKWHASLLSVSPSEAKDELARAFDSCGTDEQFRSNPIAQVEALASYGVYATLWQLDGNNYTELLREARKQADLAGSLYGFYMDRPMNRIGDTGWDTQRGHIGTALRNKEGQ